MVACVQVNVENIENTLLTLWGFSEKSTIAQKDHIPGIDNLIWANLKPI